MKEKYLLFPNKGKAITFAKGMEAIKKEGFTRPLSFEEVVKARVESYEQGDKILLQYRIDTCTGAYYKGGSNLIKLVPIDSTLINIDPAHTDAFLKHQNYDVIEGFEIDRKNAKYNDYLTKKEVLEHPVWKGLITDPELLRTYRDIIFHERGGVEKTMGVWIRKTKEYTTSRAMFIDDILNDSVAYTINYLFDNAKFALSLDLKK